MKGPMRLGTLGCTVGFMLLAPPSGQAGTVSRVPVFPGFPDPLPPLQFAADPGEENQVEITGTGPEVTVIDRAAPITVAEGTASCTQPRPNEVTCAVSAAGPALTAMLGDRDDSALKAGAGYAMVLGGVGDDTLEVRAGQASLDGGEGDDTVRGGNQSDDLYGAAGRDTVTGGSGADGVDGGPGADVIRGEGGSDRLAGADGGDDASGGDGFDQMTYVVSRSDPPIAVSLDGRRNDGPAGSASLVREDIEGVELRARRGGNVLVGNDQRNDFLVVAQTRRGSASRVDGRGGRDRIHVSYNALAFGGPGPDRITVADGATAHGGRGNDRINGLGTVFGGAGHDTLVATPGRWRGGPGTDRLSKSKPPRDIGGQPTSLFGESGNDTFDTTDRACTQSPPNRLGSCLASRIAAVRDTVSCGLGSDSATLGGRDVATGCERTRRRP
jgi:Ca2+-binding RTX toxin-like protein